MITNIANVFAHFSCPMWCDYSAIRYACRLSYRWLAEGELPYRLALRTHGFKSWQINNLTKVRFDTDIYPPLYANLKFAPNKEVADPDNPKQYNLISSSGGQVIRRSPSYCDWMIYIHTGRHLIRKVQQRYDARDWVELLSDSGYTEIVDRPHIGHHYVGVIPDEGEFGQVVWFGILGREIDPLNCTAEEESLGETYTDARGGYDIIPQEDDDDDGADYFCTTYSDFHFTIVRIPCGFQGITWVQID